MTDAFISDPLFYAIAVPAVLLVGMSKSGFLAGFGSMATPFMALTMPVTQAVAIMLPLLAVMDATGVQRLWRERDPVMVRQLMPAALMGVAIGWALFAYLSSRTVAGVVGVMSLVFLLQRRLKPAGLALQRNPHWGRLLSATSGFTSFVAHAGGPPIMAYVLPLRMTPITMTATMAVLFGAINLAKWIPYAMLGLFDLKNLATSLVLMPLAPLGVWLGVWLTRRVNPTTFYAIADLGMLFTGLKLVSDAL